MSQERTEKCVDYWMGKGDYAFTLGLMDKDEIINTYSMAENTYDLKFIDNLMKTNSDYKNADKSINKMYIHSLRIEKDKQSK